MIHEEDWYGSYSSCLSCGYVYEVGAMDAEELQAEMGSDPHRQRRRQQRGHSLGGAFIKCNQRHNRLTPNPGRERGDKITG